MRVVISQSMYFPWVGLLEQIRLADIFVHYDDVQFSKGFYNRVQIKTERGPQWLTVPLANKHQKSRICDLNFSDDPKWKHDHLSKFHAAYKSAPYLKDALALMEAVLGSESSSLSTLARQSTKVLCDYFDISPRRGCMDSVDIVAPGTGSDRILAIATLLGSTEYITGHGGKNYLDHEKFEREGVIIRYMNYARSPYPQLHGDFTPYVSALDLVANCGRQGRTHICSNAENWRQFEGWIKS